MNPPARFVIYQGDRTEPLDDEYYGPLWFICAAGDVECSDPIVIVPDRGDGSAKPLAQRIAAFLAPTLTP